MNKAKLLSSVAVLSLYTASATMTPAAAGETFDWSGLHLGGHAGYGEANYSGVRENLSPGGSKVRAEILDLNGMAGGIQGGFNWQFDDYFSPGNALVLGMEADVTFMGWKDTAPSMNSSGIIGRVDLLASVRARAGIAFEDVLVFATAGVAFADAKYTTFDTASGSIKLGDVGGVVGGGVAKALNNMVSVRADALYYIFNDRRDTSTLEREANVGDFGKFRDAFVFRVGADFKLDQIFSSSPGS